jgi:hypothetical protein
MQAKVSTEWAAWFPDDVKTGWIKRMWEAASNTSRRVFLLICSFLSSELEETVEKAENGEPLP